MKTFLSLTLALTTGLTFAQAPDKKDAPIRPTPLAPAQPPVGIRKPIGTMIRPPQLPQAVINTNSLLKVNVTYQNYNVQIPGAYPAAIFSYMLARTDGKGPNGLGVRQFADYVLQKCGPSRAASLGYVPVGGKVLAAAKGLVTKIS